MECIASGGAREAATQTGFFCDLFLCFTTIGFGEVLVLFPAGSFEFGFGAARASTSAGGEAISFGASASFT